MQLVWTQCGPLACTIAIILLTFLRPAAAQQSTNSQTDLIALSAAYSHCYDWQGNLDRSRMEQLVEELQQFLNRTPNPLNATDHIYVLSLLADAHTRLEYWSDSERENLQLLETAQTGEQRLRACKNLAGNYAIRRMWGQAVRWYLQWVAVGVLEYSGPMTLLCMSWIILWALGKKLSSIPVPLRILSRQALLACLPIVFHLFGDIFKPIASLAITGNVGTAFTTYRIDYIADLIVSIQWNCATLLLIYWLWKCRWLDTQCSAGTPDSPWVEGSPETSHSPRSRILTAALYTGVMGLGVTLAIAMRFDVIGTAVRNLANLHNGESVDPVRVVWLLSTSILSPISQELLFRRFLYRYTRQDCGVAFALTFSSLVFAGVHLQNTDNFTWFFFGGIIFAAQYEFTKRLFPSIGTHIISNFFLSLSRLH